MIVNKFQKQSPKLYISENVELLLSHKVLYGFKKSLRKLIIIIIIKIDRTELETSKTRREFCIYSGRIFFETRIS